MLAKEYSNKLDVLAKYASRVANIKLGRIKIFLGWLKLDIDKDIVIREHTLRS